jgi:long-chain fatty acid transport protein
VRQPIVALLILAPSLALASGYALPNTNPRDLSLSASAVAAQNDSAAAFALPAALARLDGPSGGLSFGFVHVFNTWKDPTSSQTVDMEAAFSPIGTLTVAYGGKLATVGNRGWGVGLGIQPFGGAIVSWPEDWPGRFRIIDVDRKVFSGVVTVGFEVIPQVRLGGGFVYYYSMQDLSQKAFLPPAGLEPKATVDVNGGAPSFDLSAEIEPIPNVPLTIAADYKHKANQTLDGDLTWEGLPQIPSLPPLLADQDIEEQLTIPNLLNIGAAYRVIQPLLVAFTFTLDRWVVYREDHFTGSNPGAEATVLRHYRNGQTYRVGAEYELMPALQLRGGIQRDVSGLREEFYHPSLPDGSSWAGSLGATYKFGRGFSASAAVFYANMDTVEVPASAFGADPPGTSGTFRGEYSPSALVYNVGLAWNPLRP